MREGKADDIEVRVDTIRDETPNIRSFRLVRADGGALPPFTAGAHVDVRIGPELSRSYSLFNAPSDAPAEYWIAVQREKDSRGGSAFMHDSVKAGDLLMITPPRNNFELHQEAPRSLLIAGGIGVTPLLSMARHLKASQADFHLVNLGRSVSDAPFQDLLGAVDMAGQVTLHFDNADPARHFDLAGLLREARGDTHVYCCGPSGLMNAVRDLTTHWPQENIHFEHFKNEAAAAATIGGAFTVVLKRSGREFDVPEGKTILDVLLENGIDADYSCMEGTCGSCLAKVLEGVPDHRDLVLDPAEKAANKTIAICCSRSMTTSLVIDL